MTTTQDTMIKVRVADDELRQRQGGAYVVVVGRVKRRSEEATQ